MDQENYNDIDMEIEMDSNDIDVSAEMPNEIVVNNYNSLKNKPSINSVELVGNKTLEDLGITEYVEGEIANFDFIKIVPQLPEKGLINRTYFVPKTDPESNDLYEEYMWINNKWEMMGTKQIQVDLTAYVKNTDYAKPDKGGTIKTGNGVSLKNGVIQTDSIDYNAYKDSPNEYFIGKGTLEKVIEGKELINKEYSDNIVEEQRLENERLRNDIKSIALTGEASGENIHLEDSSDARCEIEIGGNQKQKTRSGKNLSKVEKISTVNGGYINASSGILATVEKGETYTISLNCSSKHSGTNIINVRVFVEDSYYVQTNLNYSSGNRISRTFVASNSGELNLSANLGTDYTDVLYDIQLEKGTSATDYEQYGASPSIDYPSKVKSVNGSAKIDIFNENIFPNLSNKSVSDRGITLSYDGNTKEFCAKGITTAKEFYCNISFKELKYLNANKSYIFSIDNPILQNLQMQLTKYGVLVNAQIDTQKKSANITQLDKAKPNSILLYSNNIAIGTKIDWTFKVQIKEGTIATNYVQHEEQSYLVDVQQEMLEGDYLDLENEKEHHEWGKYIFTGDEDYNKSQTYSNEKYFCGYIPSPVVTNIKIDKKGLCNCFRRFGDYTKILDEECIRIWGQFQVRILASHLTENSAEAFKTWLKSKYDEGNPVVVYYPLATPVELDFTEAQKAVAKKIKSEAHTYKNITNILAESSEVNPIINVKYLKDTEKYIENKITTALTEINALNQVRTQMLDAEVEI